MQQTLILSSTAARSVTHANMIVVGTPLDAIMQLEGGGSISTVILAGSYANNDAMRSAINELYPAIHVALDHEG